MVSCPPPKRTCRFGPGALEEHKANVARKERPPTFPAFNDLTTRKVLGALGLQPREPEPEPAGLLIVSVDRGSKTEVDTIRCHRCKKDAPQLSKPPFKNSQGERIHEAICQNCWAEWLEHQTMLINHHGLDPRTKESRDFLYKQIESVLLGGEGGEEIDRSKKGTIQY